MPYLESLVLAESSLFPLLPPPSRDAQEVPAIGDIFWSSHFIDWEPGLERSLSPFGLCLLVSLQSCLLDTLLFVRTFNKARPVSGSGRDEAGREACPSLRGRVGRGCS